MNDLEQLLRDSLHDAPPLTPRIADPVDAVERRVSRARLRIVGGVVAVAALAVMAVVVPLQLTRTSGRVTTTGPAPTATSPVPAGPKIWWPHGSIAIASGGGSLWNLRRTNGKSSEVTYVDEVDPANHALRDFWKVANPADFIAYGLGTVWVWGGGDGGYPDGKLQAVDPATGRILTLTNNHQAFNGVAFVDNAAWVSTGGEVWQIDPSRGVVAKVQLFGPTSQHGLVATDNGVLWVRAGNIWVHIDPATRRLGSSSTTVPGLMIAPAGGDGIWTWTADDGLIAVSTDRLPKYGLQGAITAHIASTGPVLAIAGTLADGLYVVAYDSAALDTATPTLYYLPPAQIHSGTALDGHLPSVPGAGPFQLASDGGGGVDYSDGDTAYAWHP